MPSLRARSARQSPNASITGAPLLRPAPYARSQLTCYFFTGSPHEPLKHHFALEEIHPQCSCRKMLWLYYFLFCNRAQETVLLCLLFHTLICRTQKTVGIKLWCVASSGTHSGLVFCYIGCGGLGPRSGPSKTTKNTTRRHNP